MKRRTLAAVVGLMIALAGAASIHQTAAADGSLSSAGSAGISAEKAALEAQDRLLHQQLEATAAVPELAAAAIAAKAASGLRAAKDQAAQPSVEPAWPEGIFEDGEAPAPGSRFLGTNRWVGTVAGQSIAVFAGQSGEDPSMGRLLVITAGPSMSVQSGNTVDLPGVGALRVAAASGGTLSVMDSRGVAHAFDAAAARWTS